MPNLLTKIEGFMDKHAMEDTRFGLDAINDGGLLPDLRKGQRKLRKRTVRKIEDFMAAYKPPKNPRK